MSKRIKSRILNQAMTVHESGAVVFDDGVSYSRSEVDCLKSTGAAPKDILAVHRIKTLFGGEFVHEPDPEAIIERERKSPTVFPPYVKPKKQEQ